MIFGRQPAFWIGLIVSLVAGAVATLLGEGLISDALAGQVNDAVAALSQLALLAAPLIAGMLIKPTVTPLAAPQLPKGTEVKVQGTNDTVIVQPTPPGPTGIDEGAADHPAG